MGGLRGDFMGGFTGGLQQVKSLIQSALAEKTGGLRKIENILTEIQIFKCFTPKKNQLKSGTFANIIFI
jgi:hypothetical protein